MQMFISIPPSVLSAGESSFTNSESIASLEKSQHCFVSKSKSLCHTAAVKVLTRKQLLLRQMGGTHRRGSLPAGWGRADRQDPRSLRAAPLSVQGPAGARAAAGGPGPAITANPGTHCPHTAAPAALTPRGDGPRTPQHRGRCPRLRALRGSAGRGICVLAVRVPGLPPSL